MAKENRRLTKEERVEQLKRVGAPQSIINEEMKSKYASQAVLTPEQIFDDSHLDSKLIKILVVGDGTILKVYEYEKFPSESYPQHRLDVEYEGKIHRGAITNGSVQFVENQGYMVDVSSSEITEDDVYMQVKWFVSVSVK